MKAIRGEMGNAVIKQKAIVHIRKNGFGLWLALRQLLTGKRQYVGTCMVAMLLVFFAFLIGRVDAWLGPNGEGLMDAFNPADLHIAAQPMGDTGMEEVEQTIREYTDITDRYMLAMPSVSVNIMDMTANIGMNREGYDLIGEESPAMWYTHFFIENPNLQPVMIQVLEDTYGGDVYLHENSWSGLAGILSAMQLLMIFLYVVVLLFILVVTLLTAGKLIQAGQKDLGIYRTMGFSAGQLRCSFALRFGVTALLGSVLGTILSALLTDPLVAVLMRIKGISDFSSQPGVGTVLLPGVVVILLFTGFAWLAARKIRLISLSVLVLE